MTEPLSPIPPLRPRVLPSLDVAVAAIPGALLCALPALAVASLFAATAGFVAAPGRARIAGAGLALLGSVAAIGAAAGAARDYVAGRTIRRLRHAWVEGTRLLVSTIGGLLALDVLGILYGYLVRSSSGDLLALHLLVGGQVLALCGASVLIAIPAVIAVCERRRGLSALTRSFVHLVRRPSLYLAILALMTSGWLFWVSFPPLQLQQDELGHLAGAARFALNAFVIGALLVTGVGYTLARHYPRRPDEDLALEEQERAALRAHRPRRFAFVVLLVAFLALLGLWILNPTDRIL